MSGVKNAPDPATARPPGGWIAAIGEARGRGDQLKVIDIATSALAEHPASLELAYQLLLAFARSGATQRAQTLLAGLESEGRLREIADRRLRIDFAALKGRLLKDFAMRASAPAAQAVLAAQAAEAYQSAFEQSGDCFPAINAATLRFVAGQPEKAEAMARAAIQCAAAESDPYWRSATEGEAFLLLGDESRAIACFEAASRAGAGRRDAIASTRRQLTWLAQTKGVGHAALAALRAPKLLHWIADPRISLTDAAAFFENIAFEELSVVAFGSVLSGADVVIGEMLLDRGAELHLVLPCAAEVCAEFLARQEVGVSQERFERLLASARNLLSVTLEGDPLENTVMELSIMQARGSALLLGAALAAPVEALCWSQEGAVARGPVAGSSDLRGIVSQWPVIARGDPIWRGRSARAIVFGDIRGFSTIRESQHKAFFETVLGGFADALASVGDKVEYAETAGDGLYVVLSDVVSAVDACHALQRSVAPLRLAAAGLPPGLGLRLSAHVGPVFKGLDRVTGREKFYGKEVIRTARIEPVTPPGETYVTEQFAAVLACMATGRYACDYVGQQAMAKGFGECRMYSLHEVKSPEALMAGRMIGKIDP